MEYKKYKVRVYTNGNREWWINGYRHREGGPAIEWDNGGREWFLDGRCHREDGPAVEYIDGRRFWWLNGDELTEQEFIARTHKN